MPSYLPLILLLSCGPKKGAPDSAVHDSGVHDSGVHDSGVHDSGVHDSGVHDSGSHDSGSHDSGTSTGRALGLLSLDDGAALVGEAGSELGLAVGGGPLGEAGQPILVLGAPGSAAGAGVALLYGEAGGSWAPVGSVLGEQAGDGVGSALLVGDVDGDGQVDLVLGARGADGAGSGAGAMAVGLGPLSGDLELGALDAVWTGEGAGDYAGGALALGQLSGDGDPDLLVGAGRAGGASGGVGYVITAPATAGSYGLGAAGARLFGPDGALLGTALAVGDLDGDGVADAIMGGFGWSEFAGTVRVALGPLLDDIDLGADADAGLDGSFGFDLAGQSVAAADVDGDGRADLVVGVPGDDSHAPEAGEVLVFPLPAGPLSAELAGTRLLGVMDYDRTGWSVASPGDLDGDGRAELLLGAPGPTSEAGLVWLVYGGEGGSRELSLERDGAWSGPVEVGGLGNAVGGAGDVDGDGAPDLLLGAPGAATTWLWPAAG